MSTKKARVWAWYGATTGMRPRELRYQGSECASDVTFETGNYHNRVKLFVC
jgi:hypothetical protein